MAKSNDAWKRFVNLYCSDEDFRKKFDAIEVPKGSCPNEKIPKNDLNRMMKAREEA